MPAAMEPVPERTRKALEQPEGERPCRVYVHNDDVTPMDFVIHILETVFLIHAINATQIMYAAHLNGKAYVQTLPAPEARRRIWKARFAARMRAYPLDFSLEAG